MKHVSNNEEYQQFLEDIVQGRNQSDRSPWTYVAGCIVQAFVEVDGTVACTYNCEPYSSEWERIAPFDVLRFTDQEFDVDQANQLARPVAVDVIERDLEDCNEELEE